MINTRAISHPGAQFPTDPMATDAVLESLMDHLNVDTLRDLSELNGFFLDAVRRYVNTTTSRSLLHQIASLLIGSLTDHRTGSLNAVRVIDRDQLKLAVDKFKDVLPSSREIGARSVIRHNIISVLQDLHNVGSRVMSLEVNTNTVALVLEKAQLELTQLADSPPDWHPIDGLTADLCRDLWIRLFENAKVVPFDEFYAKFSGFLCKRPIDGEPEIKKAYWRWFLDFPASGCVTPFKLNWFVNAFGPLWDLESNIEYIFNHNCYGGVLERKDYMAMVADAPPYRFFFRISPQKPHENVMSLTAHYSVSGVCHHKFTHHAPVQTIGMFLKQRVLRADSELTPRACPEFAHTLRCTHVAELFPVTPQTQLREEEEKQRKRISPFRF